VKFEPTPEETVTRRAQRGVGIHEARKQLLRENVLAEIERIPTGGNISIGRLKDVVKAIAEQCL
jgi:hypothetical protein